jgi:uncharacterized protein YegP (UPF0339 family)
MATATHRSGATGRTPRRSRGAREPGSMEFLISEDNGGQYHWTIVADDGSTLARSTGFASSEVAERAAERVRDGAALAPLEHRSFSSEAVAKCKAPR